MVFPIISLAKKSAVQKQNPSSIHVPSVNMTLFIITPFILKTVVFRCCFMCKFVVFRYFDDIYGSLPVNRWATVFPFQPCKKRCNPSNSGCTVFCFPVSHNSRKIDLIFRAYSALDVLIFFFFFFLNGKHCKCSC